MFREYILTYWDGEINLLNDHLSTLTHY
jgi:hypothetical protein